jgi:hypothetical protein
VDAASSSSGDHLDEREAGELARIVDEMLST